MAETHITRRITQLPLADAVDGSELFETVQGAASKRVSLANLLKQPYVLVTSNPLLTEGRTLTVESGVLTLSDGGAGGNLQFGIAGGGVTNAKLATMATATVKGRAAGSGSGSPVDLTAAQLADVVEGDLQITESQITDLKNYADLDDAGEQTFAGDIIVQGDFTVQGTVTYIDTQTLNIGDNIITLNADEEGSPSQNAGLEIERGTSDNVFLRWNEASDQWELTNDGSTFESILTSADTSFPADPDFDAFLYWDDYDGQAEWVDAAFLTAQLNVFTAALQGAVPASGGGTGTVLRADATWGQLTSAMFPNTVVPDGALSSNVPLKDQSNTFTDVVATQARFTASAGRSTFVDDTNVHVYRSGTSGGSSPFNNFGNLILETRGDPGRLIAFVTNATERVTIDDDSMDLSVALSIGGGQAISDSDNIALLDQSNTFTAGTQTISTGSPRLVLFEDDVATDEGRYDFNVSSTVFSIHTRTDAGSFGENLFTVSRTGTTVDSINFPNGAVSITDSLAIGGGQAISDSDNVVLLDASQTFTGTNRFESGTPQIWLQETGEGADEGRWRIASSGGNIEIRAMDDDNGFGQTAFVINRGTGSNIESTNFTSGTLKYGGVEVTRSDGDTGGSGSAGAGNQYVELQVGGTTYKVLHDGTV